MADSIEAPAIAPPGAPPPAFTASAEPPPEEAVGGEPQASSDPVKGAFVDTHE